MLILLMHGHYSVILWLFDRSESYSMFDEHIPKSPSFVEGRGGGCTVEASEKVEHEKDWKWDTGPVR